jgi:hypothetical protein
MSITRDYGQLVFECDAPDCLEVLETESETWEIAKSKFDKAGWQSKHFAGDWWHYCPECEVGF